LKYLQIIFFAFIAHLFCFASCKYSFKDSAPIPTEVKNFRVQQIVNKADYVNPTFAIQLTEAVRLKVINNTRLKQTNEEEAHYDISAYVTQYAVSTVGITNGQEGQNRLSATVHLVFKNNLDSKKDFETDLTRNQDFAASQSLSQAEQRIVALLIKELADDVFNKIFSNW
jgi:outer membrane lipopolysaccharide assembly protein LptE/RlpB